MKQKIGIALLILLNSGFIYLIMILVYLSYGLINGRSGLKAVQTANHIGENIFTKVSVLSFLALFSNYLVFRFLIQNKKPILGSLITTLIGIMISIPFFFKERQSYIENQFNQVMLSDYVDSKTISKIQLLTPSDTVPVEYCEEFFQIIGNASYADGMWKYQRSMKIILWKTDGTKDSILSNGDLFELSNGKFFKAKENLVEKYLRISPARTAEHNRDN